MIRPEDLRQPVDLSAEDERALGDLLPDTEPRVDPVVPVPGGGPPRVLPVSETRLDGREREYLLACLDTNWISSQGPFVRRFEETFARAVGCRHGVACSNGTTALHLALAALRLEPGDEIIVPAFTMVAVANACLYVGATPVFVDVEPDTLNLDPALVERACGPRTRGILAAHTYGHPAAMDDLRAIADRRGLFLYEDAAEAHGATLAGRPAGSLGDAATFSFYGNKILSTGEGGMVTTNDERLAAICRRLRDHAFSDDRHFWHRHVGFNFRMTNLQAALGLAQTERFEELVTKRRWNRAIYDRYLADIPGLATPIERPPARSVFWMYGVRLRQPEFGISRDELRRRLARRGVETRTFFVPLPRQPIYHQRWRHVPFPRSEDASRSGLYLPSSSTLTEAEIRWVAEAVREARHSP